MKPKFVSHVNICKQQGSYVNVANRWNVQMLQLHCGRIVENNEIAYETKKGNLQNENVLRRIDEGFMNIK